MLTRCGYRCDLCLAYAPNVALHSENQQILSDGWFQYFGFRLPPEQIYCDGCLAENPKLIDTGCPVRPCVIERGLEHCAQCGQYICEKLNERIVTFADVQNTESEPHIPFPDYVRFIQPYENKLRLETIRPSPPPASSD